MMYDFLMRLPLLAWVSFCALAQLRSLVLYMDRNGLPTDFVDLIHVAMRISTIAFMVLMAAAIISRSRPSGKASGLEPRISALFGTFLAYGITAFPRHHLSLPLEMLTTVLTMIGTIGAVVALSQLGRSFSIMAETRRLVTTGPYRFVRHPLYLTEGIAIFALFMQFASWWTALLLVIQMAFQLRRMSNEETVLTEQFPEYTVYSQTTARLIPGVY